MTAQTASYIKNTLFATGQAAGSITPTRMQDIPDSFTPWDDPANASTLGAPAILRGTVSTYNMSGLVIGAGQSSGTRTSNATALQAAINYCQANNKFLEIPGGVYEFTSSTGLTVPATGDIGVSGFTMRGEWNATKLVQFYATTPGAPILTVADTTGATFSYGYDIQGLQLYYGASQTGFTNSNYLRIGAVAMSSFRQLQLGNYSNPAYDGLTITATTGGNFSNRFHDIAIYTFQHNGIYFHASGGTGSTWDNIYLGNNTFSGSANAYVFIDAQLNEVQFTRLNCEWGSVNQVIVMNNAPNTAVFDTLHLESIKFTGANPCCFQMAGNMIHLNHFSFVNPIIQSANFTGTASIFYDWTGGAVGSVVDCVNLYLLSLTAGNWTAPISLYRANGNALDNCSTNCEVRGFRVDDVAATIYPSNFVLDTHLPVATHKIPDKFGRYTYGAAYSKIEKAVLTISATYTLYGMFEDATINVPATITGFTLTLSNLMGATGNQNVRTGNTCRVHRMSGTVSGTLLVKDDAGTTLTTNTTAGDLWYQFTGTHYIVLTPVTS